MPVAALDASALMMPVELGVRLFDELERLLDGVELVTPRAVVTELERLAGRGSEEARAANVGLDLATERCRVVEPEGDAAENGDDALVALAAAAVVDYVVTNDGPLRERVLATGTPVVATRGEHTLAVVQP